MISKENTDAVLAKTIKTVTDRMKSKNEIELKEMVSPRDVFSSSDEAEGITFLQIPNSYARRYNFIYNQIEKLIK